MCIKILMKKPCMVAQAFNSSTQEAMADGFLSIQGQFILHMSFKIPGLCREIVSQNPPQTKKQNNAEEWNQQYLLNPLWFHFIYFDF